MDLGADPVHGEGHEPYAEIRVEALDRLHQADIAFLHQIADGQPIAEIAAGDVRDEAQVREHQRACGLDIGVIVETARERLLVFARQHGYARYAFEIGVETAEGTGKCGVRITSDQGVGGHCRTSSAV